MVSTQIRKLKTRGQSMPDFGAFFLALLFALAPGHREKTAFGAQLVRHARELVGTPYQLGGRLRARAQGIDCQGVIFYAAERLMGCGWRSFDVFPSRSIQREELGKRVVGLDPVATEDLDVTRLKAGDVLHFVGPAENPAEGAIGTLGEDPIWVWHMGLYAGEGRFVVGDHFAGEVVETDLVTYLKAHEDEYVGLFVTRPTEKTRPNRCRSHPPMVRGSTAK
jgi:hypothetical protein